MSRSFWAPGGPLTEKYGSSHCKIRVNLAPIARVNRWNTLPPPKSWAVPPRNCATPLVENAPGAKTVPGTKA